VPTLVQHFSNSMAYFLSMERCGGQCTRGVSESDERGRLSHSTITKHRF